MWDHKTGTNVSAREGVIDRTTGGNHPSIQDKKQFEAIGEDSGFVSGSQIFSSDSIDSHPSGIDRSTRSNQPSIQDKKQFEGPDSGYISSPQIFSTDSIDTHSDILPDIEKFPDSGAIDVGDDYRADDTKDRNPESMILDKSINGLTEWFCELNLKSTPVNNLGDCRKNVLDEPKYSPITKFLQNRPLWELCYVQDSDGDTQLHLAILGKYVQAVWAIIRMAPVPALLDLRNDDAHAPLHLAVLTRQPDIVRCLLVAGAKATIQDKDGNTPLHLACMNSDKACVDALTRPVTPEELQRNYNISDRIPQVLLSDLEQRNYHGMHCVHIAAQRNDIAILRHLVMLGADINAREGRSGYTALHFACENSNEQLAQFLLNECTKLNVETYTYGLLTAYQLAAEQNNRDLMGELQHKGAKLLSPPESDDDSYLGSSDEDFQNYESDDCELN